LLKRTNIFETALKQQMLTALRQLCTSGPVAVATADDFRFLKVSSAFLSWTLTTRQRSCKMSSLHFVKYTLHRKVLQSKVVDVNPFVRRAASEKMYV